MVDVEAQIEATTRRVWTITREGAPVRVQDLARTVSRPIDEVWEVLTDAQQIPRWFQPISGELRLGERFAFQDHASGTVLECVPPAAGIAHYRVSWESGESTTWVTIRLTAEGADGTRVELEHEAGADALPPGFWERFGPGATGVGWDGAFLGIALYLAGDDSVTPESAEAWAMTPEGQAFYRLSATAWANAQIADGAEPAEANAAADETYRFYTGTEE